MRHGCNAPNVHCVSELGLKDQVQSSMRDATDKRMLVFNASCQRSAFATDEVREECVCIGYRGACFGLACANWSLLMMMMMMTTTTAAMTMVSLPFALPRTSAFE